MEDSLKGLIEEITKAIQLGVEKLPSTVGILVEDFGRYKMAQAFGMLCIAALCVFVGYVCYRIAKKLGETDVDDDGAPIFFGFLVGVSVIVFVIAIFAFVFKLAAGIAPYGYILNQAMQ